MSVQGVSTQLYADDAVIFTPAKTTTEAGQILTAAANSGFKIFKCPFDGKKKLCKTQIIHSAIKHNCLAGFLSASEVSGALW